MWLSLGFKNLMTQTIAECIALLKNGGVGVLPTDTLYGLVACANNKKAVLRVRAIKGRDGDKALIILIPSIASLATFGIALTPAQKTFARAHWPNKVSIIFPCARRSLAYLHGGQNSLAFRIPKNAALRALLRKTGPLVAPSANPQGMPPAQTISEAKKYFGTSVDFYVAGAIKKGKPSTVVSVSQSGEIEVIRAGAVRVR